LRPATAKAGSCPQQSELSLSAASTSYAALRGAETLALALKATECLDGRGAFLHWCDPATRRLRLLAASGLASETAEAWADLSDELDVAPVRAMRDGDYAWVGGDSLGIGATGTADTVGELFRLR